MDRILILEAKLAELDKKLSTATQTSLKESQLLDLFFRIESCQDFDSLQALSTEIGKMPISKYESLVFALAARIRQNSLRLDDVVNSMQTELAMREEKGVMQ